MEVKLKKLNNISLDNYLEHLRYGEREGKKTIFDPIRKRHFILAPEEVTRQLVIQYFLRVVLWPENLISVEKSFSLYGQQRRYDIVLYKDAHTPIILVECKAPSIPLTNQTFEQVANYNLALQIPYLFVSNCRENYFFELDFDKKDYKSLETIALYSSF